MGLHIFFGGCLCKCGQRCYCCPSCGRRLVQGAQGGGMKLSVARMPCPLNRVFFPPNPNPHTIPQAATSTCSASWPSAACWRTCCSRTTPTPLSTRWAAASGHLAGGWGQGAVGRRQGAGGSCHPAVRAVWLLLLLLRPPSGLPPLLLPPPVWPISFTCSPFSPCLPLLPACLLGCCRGATSASSTSASSWGTPRSGRPSTACAPSSPPRRCAPLWLCTAVRVLRHLWNRVGLAGRLGTLPAGQRRGLAATRACSIRPSLVPPFLPARPPGNLGNLGNLVCAAAQLHGQGRQLAGPGHLPHRALPVRPRGRHARHPRPRQRLLHRLVQGARRQPGLHRPHVGPHR